MSSADPFPRPEYEAEDATPPTIAITAASLAGILALGIGVAVFFHYRDARYSAGRPPAANTLFQHGPEARTSVAVSWDQVDRAVREHMEGYGWIDRRAGIVHIPIERAMDLICREGIPPATELGKGDGIP